MAAPPPQPVAHFARNSEIEDIRPSPNGRRLAMLTYGDNGFRRLVVMDLDPISPLRSIASVNDADITSVRWVNDDRLVFEAFQRGAEIREGGAGTFAVNHDGNYLRQLIAWQRWTDSPTETAIAARVLPYGWYLGSTVDDDSNDVLVYRRAKDGAGELSHIEFARLDTLNRTLRNLSDGIPSGAREWLFDGKGQPRVISAERNGRTSVHWRDGEQWKQIAEFDPNSADAFSPWSIDERGLIVTTRSQSDTQSLHRFDLSTRRFDSEPLVRVAGFDLEPIGEYDNRAGRLVGMHFRADRPVSYWFDPTIAAIQKSLDAALPSGRSNRLYCGRCESTRFFVVHSISDRHPGEYLLFDRKDSSLRRIGKTRPWIDENTQGKRTFHRVTSRDGLSIPVYVTHPANAEAAQPLPAVVLVHGGPWMRGFDLSWESEAQFLASRGYVVIEPEFRGSEGYGYRHFKAGWKQWGLAIQDDLADAVAWAVSSKLVDSSRVCILGASFGGYSALMSPIAHPGVYRCAVSVAGVTDIRLMYSVAWSDISQAARRYSMPTLIGDPATEGEQLDRQSPVQRAAEIKVPVLLVHGGLDQRVPVTHAEQFVKAARTGGVEVEYVNYPSEGHGWFAVQDRADYYARVEAFLAKALKIGQ